MIRKRVITFVMVHITWRWSLGVERICSSDALLEASNSAYTAMALDTIDEFSSGFNPQKLGRQVPELVGHNVQDYKAIIITIHNSQGSDNNHFHLLFLLLQSGPLIDTTTIVIIVA